DDPFERGQVPPAAHDRVLRRHRSDDLLGGRPRATAATGSHPGARGIGALALWAIPGAAGIGNALRLTAFAYGVDVHEGGHDVTLIASRRGSSWQRCAPALP